MTTSSNTRLRIFQTDYTNPAHMNALLTLLDGYARDPMGGGEPLSDFARANLPQVKPREIFAANSARYLQWLFISCAETKLRDRK